MPRVWPCRRSDHAITLFHLRRGNGWCYILRSLFAAASAYVKKWVNSLSAAYLSSFTDCAEMLRGDEMRRHLCPCSRDGRECFSSHMRAVKRCESLSAPSSSSFLKHSHGEQAKCGVVPDRKILLDQARGWCSPGLRFHETQGHGHPGALLNGPINTKSIFHHSFTGRKGMSNVIIPYRK